MKSPKNIFLFLITILSIANASAAYLPWSEVEKKFKAEGLNTKALSHVKCFFDKYENTTFKKKMSDTPETENRCGGDANITLDKKRVFALIDYTAPSDEQRMFLVDRQTGAISMMAVAHGRYKANMFNLKLSQNKNSIKYARYFSNELGSNAPSSGFFVAGNEYEGKFGRSLTLHGLETGINDNACERAVVIHKHLLMSKSSAYAMSAGCPMISKSYIDHVINLLEGSVNEDNGEQTNGSAVFIYGPRETKWATGTCEGNFNI